MNVRTLINLLQEVNPDREVIMSKDAEGNSYSPLHLLWFGAYRADGWSGEVGLENLTDEDKDAGYSEEDVITDGVPAVVLTPTN